METTEKRDWNKIVSESNGNRIFLPDSFKDSALEVEKMRKEFNEFLTQLSEKEISLNMKTQNMFYAIRQYLAKNGIEIWTKDVGFETEALKDGVFILNIADAGRK